MPIFVYECPDGHRTELYFPKHTNVTRGCGYRSRQGVGCCDQLIHQIITAPAMVKVAQEVCYDSPIDGKPITSWAAREEDLKRSNCRPYDPEQKTDAANRRKAEEAALDTMIEAHAEEVTEKMTTAQRGKIYSELTEQGAEAQVIRNSL